MGKSWRPNVPLPSDWSDVVRSGVLHAIGLCRITQQVVRGWASNSKIAAVRLQGERDALKDEVSRLREENRLLCSRFERLPPNKRPHYEREERLAILVLRAASGWSLAETARRFLVKPPTIASWVRCCNRYGVERLVRPRTAINKMPEYIAEIVKQLRVAMPSAGRRKLAEVLARAGLHLADSTVKRLLKRHRAEPEPEPEPQPDEVVADGEGTSTEKLNSPTEAKNTLRARSVHHIWHVDITVVPTAFGFSVPWWPFSCLQCWPFSWHVAVVVDSYSRAVVNMGLYLDNPSASEICALLEQSVKAVGAPRYIVTDKGSQFQSGYLDWCEYRGIRPRFGAIGKKGSLAIVERFILTLKREGLRRTIVPFGFEEMRARLRAFAFWYNQHRPHSTLRGATPAERRDGIRPACAVRRLETRKGYPLRDRRDVRLGAPPRRRVRGSLKLVVSHVDGHRYLPYIRLDHAA